MRSVDATQPLSSLFALTNDARILSTQINATAEGLFSDDPAEVAAATQALEELITAEAGNRAALLNKADAWCWVIATLCAQADARRKHAQRLAELAIADERHAQTLKDQLINALQRVDPEATKWDLPSHKLNSRRTQAVVLDPDILPEDLPAAFQRVKTTCTPDKSAIAAALKAGQTVEGARLVERRSWRIA